MSGEGRSDVLISERHDQPVRPSAVAQHCHEAVDGSALQ